MYESRKLKKKKKKKKSLRDIEHRSSTSPETKLLTLFSPRSSPCSFTPIIHRSKQLSYFHSLSVRKHRQVKLLPRSIHQPSTVGYTVCSFIYIRDSSSSSSSSSWRRLVAHIYTPVDRNTECWNAELEGNHQPPTRRDTYDAMFLGFNRRGRRGGAE